MKTILATALVGWLGVSIVGVPPASANLEVTSSIAIRAKADFYEPLTPHGVWVDVRSYGRCWRPARVAVGWRPYCDGYWVWTDCGWYWASDEPWAWACYHYGWWVYDPVHAWIWVPGIEWAPAWVSWRFGGGYCGWAPFPPHGVVLAPSWYVFVETRHFHHRIRPRTVVINNTAIFERTAAINNVSRETRTISGRAPQTVVINNGPDLNLIQKATGKTISPVPIAEASRRTRVPSGLVPKASEPASNKNAPPVQKQPGTPSQVVPTPPNVAPELPLKDSTPPKDEVVPAPTKPPASKPPSSVRPQKPPRNKSKE